MTQTLPPDSETAIEANVLQGIPLFSELSDGDLIALAALLRRQTYAANQTIFWLGDRGTDFLIVHDGMVEISVPDENGKERKLASLKPGQFFGELSLLDGGPRTATARSTDAVTLLRLGRTEFESFCRGHAAAAFHIMSVLGRRQREMLEQLRGIRNANQVYEEQASAWHKAADFVANIFASPYFMVGQLLVMLAWMGVNAINGDKAFDAYPYSLLGLVVSIEAFFLSAFLLVSQNKQGERDRVQADLDYQVNMKAHTEVMQLHQKVDRLAAMVEAERAKPE